MCHLGYYYGRTRFIVMEPIGAAAAPPFAPPAGTRCQAVPAS